MDKQTYKQRGQVMKMNRFQNSIVALVAAVGLMFQGAVPVALAAKTDKPSIELAKVRVPEIYGTIKEVHKGNDKVIFYLQDAHANIEAQRNNARILEDLIGSYGVDTVAIEGASKSLTEVAARLAAFPDKEAMRESASFFMQEGRLMGPEYLAITGDTRFELLGLEDKALSDKNDEALLDIMPSQAEAIAQVGAMKSALNAIAIKVYSPELKAFADKADDYRAGKIRFTQYAQFMRDAAAKHGLDISGHKNFGLQGKSFQMEGSIDFDAVEDERAAIVDEVSKKLSKEDTSNLVVQSLSFRLGRLSAVEYYAILSDHCKNAGVDIASKKNLSTYIDYINVFEDIDKDALVDEASIVEASVKDKMFTSPEQRTLDTLVRLTDMLGKMYQVKLGIRDHKVYVKSSSENPLDTVANFIKTHGSKHGVSVPKMDIGTMSKHQTKIELFYNLAVERDGVLSKNAISIMKEKDLDRMAMVTGGFHTAAVVAQLKKKGFSVVVITPRITDFDVKSPYLDVMTGKKSTMERMLAGEIIQGETKAKAMLEDDGAAETLEARARTNAVLRADDASRPAKVQALREELGASATVEAAPGVLIFSVQPGVFNVVSDEGALPTGLEALGTPVGSAEGRTAVQITVGEGGVSQEDLQRAIVAAKAQGKTPSPAKIIGATFVDAAFTADLNAAILAGTLVTDPTTRFPALTNVNAIAEILGIAPADVDLGKVEYRTVSAASGVLHPDDNNFFGKDNFRARANVVVKKGAAGKPDRIIIGIPEPSNTGADQELVKLALVKDVVRGFHTLLKAADPENPTENERRSAGNAGHQGQVHPALGNSYRQILEDLQYYDLATLAPMASDAQTQAEIDQVMANPSMTDAQKGFGVGLARTVQAYIQGQLVSRDAADLTAVGGLDTIVAMNKVQEQLGVAVDRTLETKILAEKGIQEPGQADAAIPAEVAAVLNAGAFSGYKYYETETYSPITTEERVAQSIKEMFLSKALADADKSFPILMKYLEANQEIKEALFTDLKEFTTNVENALEFRTNANGEVTNYNIKSANAKQLVDYLTANGVKVTFYTTKALKDDAELAKLVDRGLAIAKAGDNKVAKPENLHLIRSDTSLANVISEAGSEKGKIAWAAYKGDDVDAVRTAGINRVAVGSEGVSFDRIMIVLTSKDPALVKKVLVDAGYSAEEADAAMATVRSGELLPPASKTKSILDTIRSQSRDISVAA